MAWSKEQKQTAGIAAKSAGLDAEARKLILRQIPGNRATDRLVCLDDVTSRSRYLTNGDFEYFMAVVERNAGGELRGWPRGHWARKADDELARMRRKIERDMQQLSMRGLLQMDGFVRRQTSCMRERLEECDAHDLYKLIEGIKVIAYKKGVNLVT